MFVIWEEEQYRSATIEQLHERAVDLAALCDDQEVDVEQLTSEVDRCTAAIEEREARIEARSRTAAALARGEGRVAKAWSPDPAAGREGGDDPTSTEAYRRTFMEFSVRGRRSDELSRVNGSLRQLRSDESTLTSDVQAAVPSVLVNRILEKAESYGMILPLVTKTSYPAGMEIPVATVKPVASWVGEGSGSDRQKATATEKVTFTYHKLRCEVSMSMEASVMTLSAFESLFVERVARAMVVAKEKAIIGGTGSGQPKGILKEDVPQGQTVKVPKATGPTYQTLVEAEGALPAEYEANAKWFMSKKTFMSFQGMTDSNGQPVARTNYGIGGSVERTLLGREVVCTGDYLPNLTKDTDDDTVVAFIFDMRDYILNSSYDMGISRK